MNLCFWLITVAQWKAIQLKKAAECLEVFFRSLPLHSYYSIIRFRSDYEKLFEESIECNEETVQKGLTLISNIDADLGGTQSVPLLSDLFKQNCKIWTTSNIHHH